MMILALAMKAGGPEADGIRAALPAVVDTYEGATGSIAWNERGQRIDPPIELKAYEGGRFVVIGNN